MKARTLLPIYLLCLWPLMACDPSVAPDPGEEIGLFDHPQPLVFVGDLLVVGNVGYRPDGQWAPGSLTVLDPRSGALINRIQTSQNPQRLVVHGGELYVVATGIIDARDFDHLSAGPGALDVIPLDQLRTAQRAPVTIAIPQWTQGPVMAAAPLDLSFAGDRGLLTLGIANAVRGFDPTTGSLSAPIWLDTPRVGLGAVASWGERFVVVDFNADTLQVLEPDGRLWPCVVDLGTAPNDLEGPNAVAVQDATAYVTLAFSGHLRRVDLTALDLEDPACVVPVDTLAAPIGDVPNDLHLRGGEAWVLDSGQNALVAFDLTDGRPGARYVVPPGGNAWHAAWHADGRLLAITEYATHGVSVFDTLTGERWRFGGPHPAAPPEDLAPQRAQVAEGVVSAPEPAFNPQFGDPSAATNGVQGGGASGGLDVYSIGPQGALVLRWPGQRLLDGPGADLAVFENPFALGEGHIFMDLVVVEVSRDGETWIAFEHDYRAPDEGVYRDEPDLWVGFAGRTPVYLHAERNPVDPFGPYAGGDQFDLAELPPGPEADAIRSQGAVYVRLSAATAWTNPDTGAPFVADPISDGPDIDGIAARWLAPETP